MGQIKKKPSTRAYILISYHLKDVYEYHERKGLKEKDGRKEEEWRKEEEGWKSKIKKGRAGRRTDDKKYITRRVERAPGGSRAAK